MGEKQIDQDLADSITMLEQLLEIMPNDVASLKALYKAYTQCDDMTQALVYFGQLVELVAAGSAVDATDFVANEMARLESTVPLQVVAMRNRLERGADEPVADEPEVEGRIEIDIGDELALAWRLYEEEQFSQEEYSRVLSDLTDLSAKDYHDVPVTMLHALEDQSFVRMEKLLSYLSTRSGVPFVRLSQFEIDRPVAQLLPVDDLVRYGVLPFALFGEDVSLAVLNPFNTELVVKLEQELGRRCHTYLVDSVDFDHALGRIRGVSA